MKWFKHYSGANNSESLSILIDELGFQGYGRYWRLMEFLSENFDGEDTSFRLHRRNIRDTLRVRSWNDLATFMEHCGNVAGMSVKLNGNIIEIEAPILLELKNRDFKRARQVRKQTASRIERDKDKDKDKDKEHTIAKKAKSKKDDFSDALRLVYKNLYPRKGEPSRGIVKLLKVIKSQKGVDEFALAVSNYAKQCEAKSTEQEYIKKFATFCDPNVWPDFVNTPEIELTYGQKAALMSQFLDNNERTPDEIEAKKKEIGFR